MLFLCIIIKRGTKLSSILITGGAGFIGSSLADQLLAKSHKVIVVDNFSDYYSPILKEQNIRVNLDNPLYTLYRLDIENYSDLETIFKENSIDTVVHLAGRAGVRPSIDNPIGYVKSNIEATTNILELMKIYNVQKMIFGSSSSIYGNCDAKLFSEDLVVTKPISPYAATKSACEQICYTYHHLYAIKIICLRFFTVYGPRQRPDLAIRKFIEHIKADKPIDMYGDGSSLRDYTYIDDITNGVIATIDYDETDYDIINIGGGKPVTLKEMIRVIEKCLNKKAIINQLPMQAGDVERTIADISKAKNLLNYSPQFTFEQGVQNLIDFLRKK